MQIVFFYLFFSFLEECFSKNLLWNKQPNKVKIIVTAYINIPVIRFPFIMLDPATVRESTVGILAIEIKSKNFLSPRVVKAAM